MSGLWGGSLYLFTHIEIETCSRKPNSVELLEVEDKLLSLFCYSFAEYFVTLSFFGWWMMYTY